MTGAPNQSQAEFWSSAPGAAWVENAATLDTMMAPVLRRLLDEARLPEGARVLDIGCGTGASSLEAARAVGPAGHVTGADISPVMLARARERAAQEGLSNTAFVEADAQTHSFAPDGFEAMISRFGMMFFADPVAAFANIARALRPGARLSFIAWGPVTGNPWFAVPRAAAVERLGAPAPADPRAPGPMAFSDADYVTDMLTRAGLADAAAQVVSVTLTPPGTLRDAAGFATQVGPASRILREKEGTEEDARAIEAAVHRGMEPFVTADGLHVPAVLNLFTARAAGAS